MLDQCIECGEIGDDLILDVDTCGYTVRVCAWCYRNEDKEE